MVKLLQNSELIHKRRIYIAGPLFSEAELRFNECISDLLKPFFNVYLPQLDGGYMLDLIREGMDPIKASSFVFKNDINALYDCDYLLINLDGITIDEGAAFELGVAYTLGKACLGIHTDRRRFFNGELNPMLSNSIIKIFDSLEELEDWAKSEYQKNKTIVLKNRV